MSFNIAEHWHVVKFQVLYTTFSSPNNYAAHAHSSDRHRHPLLVENTLQYNGKTHHTRNIQGTWQSGIDR